mmetsp:Transcript_28972/g.61227  ORF Transcript_28972/g.61227 Transcript_28972/m.61227 type:complete len:145 (-) Transcript_28972:171-605(-)
MRASLVEVRTASPSTALSSRTCSINSTDGGRNMKVTKERQRSSYPNIESKRTTDSHAPTQNGSCRMILWYSSSAHSYICLPRSIVSVDLYPSVTRNNCLGKIILTGLLLIIIRAILVFIQLLPQTANLFAARFMQREVGFLALS